MRLFLTLLALVLAFGFIDARRLLGSEKCTWGPSYWCSGLRQSSKCQATSHCIDRVWSTNPYPEDDDDVCKICKEMVKEARDQLISNETQVLTKNTFEKKIAKSEGVPHWLAEIQTKFHDFFHVYCRENSWKYLKAPVHSSRLSLLPMSAKTWWMSLCLSWWKLCPRRWIPIPCAP